jgi:hypothetical protein
MTRFFRPRRSNKYLRMSGGGRPAVPLVYCPEMGEEVPYTHCFECPHFRVFAEGDIERCRYEYEELKQRGYYAKDQDEWLEYLHDLDPETWQELIEQKENMERVRAEMEAEQLARPAPAEEQTNDAAAKKEDGERENEGDEEKEDAEKDEDEEDDEASD